MPKVTDRKLRVFLCHASQDKPIVRELYQCLLAEGWIDPWLDEEKLLPGHNWDMEIEKAVENTDAVIICLSNNSLTKEGYIQKELNRILDKAEEKPDDVIYVIPLRLEACEVPWRLKKYQYLDFFKKSNLIYEHLFDSLKTRASSLSVNINDLTEKAQNKKENKAKHEREKRDHFSDLDTLHPVQKTKSGHDVYIFGDIEFVKVPSGNFLMGSLDAEFIKAQIGSFFSENKSKMPSYGNEKPQHIVNIPYDYLISCFPVTNSHFFQYVDTVKPDYRWMPNWQTKQDHPAVNIKWEIALDYCKWLNEKISSELPQYYVLRLPTEAEWEKAARGTDGLIFPWGSFFDFSQCNVYGRMIMGFENIKLLFTNPKGLGEESYNTTPVKFFSPIGDSPYGVSDMAGNIYEWTTSLQRDYPYDVKDGREEINTSIFESRVKRGGSCNRQIPEVRAAYRSGKYSSSLVGIRLVIAPPIKTIIARSILDDN
jgi:formylglycine-generating enzyme required for sulfatase activity